MDIRHSIFSIVAGCTLISGAASCVKTDFTLGNNVIPDNEKFITKVIEIPVDSIELRTLDNITGLSMLRSSIGAIRDESGNLIRHGSAISLVPMKDTVNWGKDPKFKDFVLCTSKDTLNMENEDQRYILQNLRVYSLEDIYGPDEIGKVKFNEKFKHTDDITNSMFSGKEPISLGTPMYGGEDNVTIYLNERFAKSYMGEGGIEVSDSVSTYTMKHPGLYICTDDPMGTGGRVNMFKISLDYDSSSYLISDCYAELKYTAGYEKNGVMTQVDTSVIFMLGAGDYGPTSTCYAFNACEHVYAGGKAPVGKAKESIIVEGGTGIKPMIRAEYLKKAILKALMQEEELAGLGEEEIVKNIIFNKATIRLPFSRPDNYKDWRFYPQTLNPTLKIRNKEGKGFNYVGLTDASVSDENQGSIDSDILSFHPDITHHMYEIVTADDAEDLEKADIWFLILSDETYTTKSGSSSSTDDYYAQMAYLNYYNQMMGGYGGYGYGGYGYGYNSYGYGNYYNYYMMQAMYSNQNSDSTTSVSMLDTDRYYNCTLNGPKAQSNVPKLQITYSFARNRD